MVDYDTLHSIWSRSHAAGSPAKFVRDEVICRELATLVPGKTLDAGCGTGEYSILLERLGHRITAFDPSPAAVETMKASLDGDSRIEFQVNSIEACDPGTTFDHVVCIEVLEHLEDDRRALLKLHSLLKPGGTLILSVPSEPRLYSVGDRISGHFRRYSHAGLISLVKESGFSSIEAKKYGFPVLYLYSIIRKLFLDRLLIRFFSAGEPRAASSRKWILQRMYAILFRMDLRDTCFPGTGIVLKCHKQANCEDE